MSTPTARGESSIIRYPPTICVIPLAPMRLFRIDAPRTSDSISQKVQRRHQRERREGFTLGDGHGKMHIVGPGVGTDIYNAGAPISGVSGARGSRFITF